MAVANTSKQPTVTTIGLKMAKSKLLYCSNQVRYLSQYFLHKGLELVHGADIYAGYMNDRDFVLKIEEEGKARDFFTIEFTKESLRHLFPDHYEKIFNEFLKMVFFDAIVGNNDRHFYNWGVIRSIAQDEIEPCFSPVYDTARGLFWNFPEEKMYLCIMVLIRTLQKLKSIPRSPCLNWAGKVSRTLIISIS